MRNSTKLLLIFVIPLFILLPVHPVQAQGSVEFSDFSTTNHFPEGATFRARVISNGSRLVSAKFVFSNDGYYSTESYSKITVDILPGRDVDLEFVWFTGLGTTPPWPVITYYWDVVDEDGNHYQSGQMQFRYDDARFDWQVLENGDVGVWWHDRSASFGQDVFDIAARAVSEQKDLFQVSLEYPVRVVIYNSHAEYEVAFDWVGGQTVPDYGVTVQVVESSLYQGTWLKKVVPHEISHLYFAQATHNPAVSIPVWLDEGVAQYNEYVDHLLEGTKVREAAKDGTLISLSSLANGFGGYNEERVYLAYYESWSAVDFFAKTFGEKSLGALLQAYKSGETTDDAFKAAIGIDAGEFETQWATKMGVPDDYVTPTPWALPTFRPAPTMVVRGQTVPTPRPTQEVVFTETPVQMNSAPERTGLPCTSFAPVLTLGFGTLLYRQNHRKRGNHV